MKYFFIKSLSPTKIKAELHATLGEFASSFTTIQTLVADFKLLSVLEDEKVHKSIISDRLLKLTVVAEIAGVTYFNCYPRDEKLSARWVPHLVTPKQKIQRLMVSEQFWLSTSPIQQTFFSGL